MVEWVEWGYDDYIRTFSTGSVSSLDTSVKARKKKQPLGFAPPKPKRKKPVKHARRS